MPNTLKFNLDGVPYSVDWSYDRQPTTDELTQLSATLRPTTPHRNAALQFNAPKLPNGLNGNDVANYRAKYFEDTNAQDSDPAKLLQTVSRLPLSAREAAIPPNWSPVGRAALLQKAYEVNPTLPQTTDFNAAHNAATLGITVQQARAQGISPALEAAQKARQNADLKQRDKGQAYRQALRNPDGAFANDYDSDPLASPASRALLNAPAPPGLNQVVSSLLSGKPLAQSNPSTVGTLVDAAAHQEGTYQEVQQTPGFRSHLATGLLGFAEPESLELLAGTAGLGAITGGSKIVGKALLGGFAVPTAQAAYRDIQQGDYGGAAGDVAAFALPLAAHGALQGKEVLQAAKGFRNEFQPGDLSADPYLQQWNPGAQTRNPSFTPRADPHYDASVGHTPIDAYLGRRAPDASTPNTASGALEPRGGVDRNATSSEAGPGVSLESYLADLEQQARGNLQNRARARQPQPLPADNAVPNDAVPTSASRATNDVAAANLPAPTVADVPTNTLHVNPDVFQYKQGAAASGATGSIPADVPYNPDLAGTLTVWRDSKGEIGAPNAEYVVNGHNRFAKAQSAGVDSVPARYLDAPDAATARYKGALINIAEGQGTALDAAKIFREKGTRPEELQNVGLPLKGKIASDGLALSKLDDFLYRQVANGSIPETTGAAIGRTGLDSSGQQALFSVVDRAQKAGKTVSPADIEQLAHDVRNAPTTTTNTENLFGAEGTQQQNLAIEKAQIAAHVKGRLAEDQRLFGGLTKQSKADALARGNNHIDTGENTRLAGEAARNVEAFDSARRLNHPGIDAALNEAALQEAQGANKNVVREQLYQHVKQSLSSVDSGGAASRPSGRAGAPASGELGLDPAAGLFDSGTAPTEPDAPAHIAANRVDAGRAEAAEPSPSATEEPLAAAQKKTARLQQIAADKAAQAEAEPLTPAQKKAQQRAQKQADTAANLDAIEAGAKKRLSGGLNSRIDAGRVDYAIIGSVKIARGAHSFAEFSHQMLSEFGEAVKPHLSEIYAAALDHYHSDIADRFNLPRVTPDTEHSTPNTQPEAAQTAAQHEPQPRADEEPQRHSDRAQEGTGRRAGNVNLDRLDTSEDVKQAIQQTVSDNAQDIEQARGGRISHEETKETAKALGLTEKQLQAATPPGATAAYHVALRQLFTDSAEKLQAAREAYQQSPSAENQAALQLAASEHQVLLSHVSGAAAEAGRTLSAYRIMAEAFKGMDKTDPVEDLFQPVKEGVREATNPRSREYGSKNKLVTAADAEAARARIKRSITVNTALDPRLFADVAKLGLFHLEAGLRQFPAWAAKMKEEVPDLTEGDLQDTWAGLRAEAQKTQNLRLQSSVFVDQLAQRLGRQNTAAFVESLRDEHGSTELLNKLVTGQDLTPEEAQTVASAYLDNQRQRSAPAATKSAINTVVALAKEARQEKAAAAKSATRAGKPAPSIEQQFETKLKQQLGNAGADKFLSSIDKLKQKLVNGEPLDTAEKARVAEAFEQAKRPKATPAALDAASQALKDIVAESRKTAQEQAKQTKAASNGNPGPTAAPQTPLDIARKLLLEDSKADADRIAQKLAGVGPDDVAALNRVMRQESKIPLSQQILSFRKAGLLSSPRTIAKILTSHGIFLAAEEVAHLPASLVDALISLKTKTRTTAGTNPIDLLSAAKTAATQGVKEAGLILQHGEQGAQAHGVKPIGGTTTESLFGEIHTRSPLVDAYINTVSRMHGAAYRPFKLFALTRALQEQARLTARSEGHTGEAFQNRVKELIDNPTGEMSIHAIQAAEEAVFLNRSPASEAFQGLKRNLRGGNYPGAGVTKNNYTGAAAATALDFAIPITKVPANIVSKMFEYATGGLWSFGRAGLDARNGLPFDQEAFVKTFGRGATGLGVMYAGYVMAKHGQAKGVTDKKEGGTVTLGGRSYELNSIAPVGNLFLIGATMADPKAASGHVKEAALKLTEELPYTRAAADLVDPRDPNGLKYAGNAAGSFVPTFLSDIAAQMDNTTRKRKTVGDYMKNRVPGLRQTLPPGDYPESNKLFDPFNSRPAH